jgi:3-oxoacyl-[acyl-carrier-protein] synthase-1
MKSVAQAPAVYLNQLGIVSALGNSREAVLANLSAGHAPGMVSSDEWIAGRSVPVGRVMGDLPPVAGGDPHWDTRVNRLLWCALQQMEKEIAGAVGHFGRERVGVVIGTSTSGIAEGEAFRADPGGHPDYCYRQQEIGAPALFAARALGLRGPCLTVSTACSSSAKALLTARNWLEQGLCDAAIAGGADSLCRLTVNGFDALGLVSGSLCRPFQADRTGINIGEGAAVFLASREAAPVRLAGVGESSDAHHISAPHPDGVGAIAAMRRALEEAGLEPGQVDYINLHGTATPANDFAEAKAVREVFGGDTPCTSTKPLTGHTLGAAGATEAGLCWLLMDGGALPAQTACSHYDATLPRISLLEQPFFLGRSRYWRMLSNSFAFGGSNVSVLLEKDNRKPIPEP